MIVGIAHQAIADLLVRFVLVCRLDADFGILGDDFGFLRDKGRLFDESQGMAVGAFDLPADHRFVYCQGRTANTTANVKSARRGFLSVLRIPLWLIVEWLKLVFIAIVSRRWCAARRRVWWLDGLGWVTGSSRRGSGSKSFSRLTWSGCGNLVFGQAVGAVDCLANLARAGIEPGSAVADDRKFILRSLRFLSTRWSRLGRFRWLRIANFDGFGALGAGPRCPDICRFDLQAGSAMRAGHREHLWSLLTHASAWLRDERRGGFSAAGTTGTSRVTTES